MLSRLTSDLKSEFKCPPPLTIFILMAFLTCWSTFYLRNCIDIDMAWLLECLERFLAGGTYTKDFYESNPPLSFWIYLPAYPLYTYLDIEPKLSVFVTILTYLIFSDVVLFYLLRKENFSGTHLFIIINAIIVSQLWATGDVYGSKDHLITAFLLPLSLYQFRLTRELETEKLIATSSIILGGIAICLKPHYAIIPALFFAHRLYVTRSLLKCVSSPDFWGMLIIGISYIASIFILTPEFFDLIPQITSLYRLEKPQPIYYRFYYATYALSACACAYFLFSDENQKTLRNCIYILSAFSIICLIPYALQGKGYHYQALPTLCYGATAAFIAIFGIIKELTKCKSDIALWATYVVIIIAFGGYTWGNKVPKLTKEQFMELPLPHAIDELAWNRVYANYHYKHLLSQLPKISSLESGSRFVGMWPLTGLIILANNETNPEKCEKIKQQMYEIVDMIAEDMKHYKPSVILIPQYISPSTHKPTKNYYNFLMGHEGFKENMNNYTFHDTIIFDVSYAPEDKNMNPLDLVPHDIYVLNRDNNL